MRNLDDLESAWRGEHDQRLGQIQGLQTATRDANRFANRMASAGDPMMNGFAVRDAAQYADQMGQRAGQAQDSYNSWAAGREAQHERNLMNASAETNQYNAETARRNSDNQLAGQQALANSISSMGNSYSQMPNQQQGGNSASIGLYGSGGEQIGGGSVLGGLIQPNETKHSQQVNARRRR
jgi:hypothetical protein